MSYLTCLVLEDGPLEWITFEREWNLVKTPGIWCHVQLSTNISSELGKLVIREFEFLMRFSFRTEHGDPRSFNQECQLFHFFLTTLVQVVKNGFCKASGNERKKPVPTPKPNPLTVFFFISGRIYRPLRANGYITADVYHQQLDRVNERWLRICPALVNRKCGFSSMTMYVNILQKKLEEKNKIIRIGNCSTSYLASSDIQLFRPLEYFTSRKTSRDKEQLEGSLSE